MDVNVLVAKLAALVDPQGRPLTAAPADTPAPKFTNPETSLTAKVRSMGGAKTYTAAKTPFMQRGVKQHMQLGAVGVAKAIQGLPGAVRGAIGPGGSLRQSLMYSVPQMLGNVVGKVQQFRSQRRAASGVGAQTPEQVRAQRQQVGGSTAGRFR